MAPSKMDTSTTPPSSDAHPSKATQNTAHNVLGGSVRKTILFLALPVLAEQMLNTFVGLFDTWLAGRISAAATSAVGLAAYVSWLGTMIVMLVGTGTTALVARHKGAGESAEANLCTNQSMTMAAILGLFLFVLLYTFAPMLAAYTRLSGDAFNIAVTYLRVDSFGQVFMGLILVGSAALRGVGDMRSPMLIFMAINGVNVLASYVLVYVFQMGVNGIVYGTIISRGVGAVIMVTLLVRGCSGLVLIRSQLPVVWARARRILRIGIPAAADGAVMWTGHFIFLAIIARAYEGVLGQACFAAHIVAIRVEALVYLPATAWGAATATMIGQSLGRGDPWRAKRAGLEAVLQCGLLSVIMALFFYLGAAWIFEQMTIDPLVRVAGVEPFRVLALFQPLLVISIVFIHGMRGAGDTRVPLLITIVGILIRLSMGYYFCIIAGWGLIGAWMGMFGAMTWRATAAAAYFLSGRWITTRV